ncbi:hypothetical protein V8C40DRAFT_249831 [Trichoderma camerunense]
MPPSRSLCSRPSAVVVAVVVVVVPSSSSSSPSLSTSRGVVATVVGGHMAPFTPSRSRHLPCLPPSISRHARLRGSWAWSPSLRPFRERHQPQPGVVC